MRISKSLSVCIMFIFLFSIRIVEANCLKLLKVQEPDKGKYKLNLHLDNLKAIIEGFNLEGIDSDIEFIDQGGNVLATLGKVKNGNIKWEKVVDNTYLQVKFDKDGYKAVLEKIKEKSHKPGFLIKAGSLESCQITFMELPDLVAVIKNPINGHPGQTLAGEINVTIENRGTGEARDVWIQLVISRDADIPIQVANFTKEFKEDGLLEGGESILALLKPGEKKKVSFNGTLKVPDDTTPAKYYLGVVADPGNKIEEIAEDNNKEVGFIMISIPEPKRILVTLPESRLIYQPTGFSLKIFFDEVPLSNGKDWRKCAIRPYIHQLKNVTWEDFFWEVDTIDRSVWRVKKMKFCRKGGTADEIKMKVSIKGGSRTSPPINFTLGLSDTQLEYEPSAGKFKISAFGDQINHASLWRIFKIKPHLYQIKQLSWENFYWELDAFKKELRKVTGGNFGQVDVGGTVKVLNAEVTVEN